MSVATSSEERARAEVIAAALRIKRQAAAPRPVLHDYQRTPAGDWSIWAIIAGRGAGKTFTGANFLLDGIEAGDRRLALVGRTSADVRDVMVEGPSGIIRQAEARGWRRPIYESSRRRVTFDNGAVAFLYSAEEPDLLRGPEHERAWADELAAWKYADAWSNLRFGLRVGERPRLIATTTPKPVPLVRDLLKRHQTGDPAVVITRGSTRQNAAHLSPDWLAEIEGQYAGTRIGRQELEGELLEDVEGALWTIALIDGQRIRALPPDVTLRAVVVGVDPAATSTEGADETGIIAVGAGTDKRGYVLGDYSLRGAPLVWARKAIAGYEAHEANFIVVETNNGGEMVTQTIKTVDPTVPVRAVHASRGKQTRAEPISALYEQGWISHLGSFPRLEEQMTTWVPGLSSPDRMDALVWGFTALRPYLGNQRTGGLI